MRVLKRANRRLLDWSFGHPKTLMTIVLTGVVAAGLFAMQLPALLPAPFNEGTLTINMLFNPGISLAESHRVGLIAERLIMEVPEVEQVGRRTAAPSSMNMRKACTRRRSKWPLRQTEGARTYHCGHSLATFGPACRNQCRPADFPPARPHAFGRARADRAQDIR